MKTFKDEKMSVGNYIAGQPYGSTGSYSGDMGQRVHKGLSNKAIMRVFRKRMRRNGKHEIETQLKELIAA